MKISEIINEAQVKPYTKEELDLSKLNEFLEKNCSDAYNYSPPVLWGGFRVERNGSHAKPWLIDPSSGERRSENTMNGSNQYTLIMDNSPYLKNYPKRSKSFIGSTSFTVARSYGEPCAIFPVNGTKIAVCPYMDLWDTKLDLRPVGGPQKGGIDAINYYLSELGFDQKTYGDLVAYGNNPKTQEFIDTTHYIREENKIPANKIISYLQEQLSPDQAGFKLLDISQLGEDEFNKEIWFSGPCVVVPYEIYKELK